MASQLTDKTSKFIAHALPRKVFTVLFSVLASFTSVVSRGYGHGNFQNCPSVLSLMFFSCLTPITFFSALVTTSFCSVFFTNPIPFHNDHSPIKQHSFNKAAQ